MFLVLILILVLILKSTLKRSLKITLNSILLLLRDYYILIGKWTMCGQVDKTAKMWTHRDKCVHECI